MSLLKTHDPRCEELAAHFLKDHHGPVTAVDLDRMACAIQQAAEDVLADLARELTAKRDPIP